MNKELVIHVVIGAAAVAAIYWAWKKIQWGRHVTTVPDGSTFRGVGGPSLPPDPNG